MGKLKRSVMVGSVEIGGHAPISVQSMASVKTECVDRVVSQIREAVPYGLEIMRVSVLDEKDARAIKGISDATGIPIVADIHFDYRLALASIENGAAAVRINPGNIGKKENVEAVVKAASEKRIPIRIGINGGSLLKGREATPEEMLEAAKRHIDILEEHGFHDIVVSLKSSSPLTTIKANELFDEAYDYPLHVGATEAGPLETSLIRSAAVLSPLLLKGIGNTIRLSLTEDPVEETKAAMRLLRDLELRKDFPFFVSCPTCGRTQVNLIPLARKVRDYLESRRIPLKVAVMGCIVNGPGEASDADVGIAGGHGVYALFKKGVTIRTVKENEAYEALVSEIESLL